MPKKILCMGSINIDLIMYMQTMPVPGETVNASNFETFSGGKGGNQAAAAAKLGGDVRYFTKLGDDVFSKKLTEDMSAIGVDMGPVEYLAGETSGVAMIRVDSSGQNSISFTPGANGKMTIEDIHKNEKLFADNDILMITMEIDHDVVYEAISVAKANGMIVVLDPAPAPSKPIPSDIAAKVDFVKPNETEAQILCGIPISDGGDASKALDALMAKGFKQPLLTMAEKGAFTVIDGEIFNVTPLKVDTVDSTAAGDVFLGAFVAALSNDKPLKECLLFANAAAALSTTRKGAQTSIPSVAEAESLMKG